MTDFLNAAYYRRAGRRARGRRPAARLLRPDDLLVPQGRGRLRVDRPARRSTARSARERFDTERSARGTLDREQLLRRRRDAARRLVPGGLRDDAPRAGGSRSRPPRSARPTTPSAGSSSRKLGALTPETRAARAAGLAHLRRRSRCRRAEGVIGALTQPGDVAGLRERARPLHAAARRRPARPDVRDRGRRRHRVRPPGLHARLRDDHRARHAGRPGRAAPTGSTTLEDGLARYGDDEPRAVPEGGEPLVGFDLTTHEGHFMGSGHNRLAALRARRQGVGAAAGTWDPMPWHLDQAYRRAGQDAQHAFWGEGDAERLSMLHQLALGDR